MVKEPSTMNKTTTAFVLTSLLINSCIIMPKAQQTPTMPPEFETATALPISPSAVPSLHLPETDQIIFTIPNPEPASGREGEARPDWLGWGAETFVVAPDGSFWIDDTAVYPNRLLHYSPQGELLAKISLENMVVYAYDLAITQNSLWILDVSSQPPKIVQLDMNGTYQSSIEYLPKLRSQNDQLLFGGRFNLSVGSKGELLFETHNGRYEMIDASGKITARPLKALEYYGHTYQTGIFNEADNTLPIYVDSTLLDIDPEFFVEMPFLGFQPDGSFAVAGWVEDSEHQIDHQVRYYSVTGELLGTARQQPQTFGKDWNHHLAFGPDGSVYQLLSNWDHSVQILRLGFSDELTPLALPAPTSTPLTALQPSDSATTDEEQARNALLAFFSELSAGNYEEAAAYYGGEKIEYAREQSPSEMIGEYWEYICTTVLWCIPVTEITETEQISDSEFIFSVVFTTPDGMRFEMGACCGGDPAASPPVWQFAYPVRKIDGKWKVMRGPVFTP